MKRKKLFLLLAATTLTLTACSSKSTGKEPETIGPETTANETKTKKPALNPTTAASDTVVETTSESAEVAGPDTEKVTETVTESTANETETTKVPETQSADNVSADKLSGNPDDVKALYLQELVLQDAVRTLVAERLNTTSFVNVDAVAEYDVNEVQVDATTGNPIVSGATKAMLKAIADNKSIDEIVSDTIAGAGSGIEDYLVGKLQSTVTDAIGVDIFSAVDFISAYNNANSTPKVLLQNIVNDQQEDVTKLATFLHKKKMNAADILKISQLVYCIHVREGEICAITGDFQSDSYDDYLTLRELASQYAGLEAAIKIYAAAETAESNAKLSAADMKAINEVKQEISETLDNDSILAELTIGDISVNYDVKSFVDAQKNSSQTAEMGSWLSGFLGSTVKEDILNIENEVQQKRSSLYKCIYDFMEESFAGVVNAKEQYDISLRTMELLQTADDNAAYLVKAYTQDDNHIYEYEAAKRDYVAALEKYYVDISYAYQFYACILTKQQTGFLNNLRIERDAVKECIDMYDMNMFYGYIKEERDERYQTIMDAYISSVDYIQVRGASLGQAPGFSGGGTINKYNGMGEYHSYVNDDKVTVIIRVDATGYIYDGGCFRYYYDTDGNPIFVHIGNFWISFFENEIMSNNLTSVESCLKYQQGAIDTLNVVIN